MNRLRDGLTRSILFSARLKNLKGFSESGHSAIEISLVIAVIVLVLVTSIPPLRQSILGTFNHYLEQINQNNPSSEDNLNIY